MIASGLRTHAWPITAAAPKATMTAARRPALDLVVPDRRRRRRRSQLAPQSCPSADGDDAQQEEAVHDQHDGHEGQDQP